MLSNEELVFRNLYRNMDFTMPHNKSNIIMNLFSIALPIVAGVVVLCIMGFYKLVKFLGRRVDIAITKSAERRERRAEQRQIEREVQMQIALEKAEAERLAEERLAQERDKEQRKATQQEIRDKAVVQLRNLVDGNGGIINYSILQTKQAKYFGKDNFGEGRMCAWVQFALYDCKRKEIISINDLINIVCYDNMIVSSKDGKFLKGSIILPYIDIVNMEDRLRTLLQTRVALICNL